MVSMISYYLPLLPWLKKALEMVSQSMPIMLWKRKEKSVMSWLAGMMFVLRSVLVGHRYRFYIRIWWLIDLLPFDLCLKGAQPSTEMVAYFIEKTGIQLGNMTVEANWWNVHN